MAERKLNREINPKIRKLIDRENGKADSERRFYECKIEATGNTGLNIQTNGNGFNPYEILGFLDLIKSNILKSLRDNNG